MDNDILVDIRGLSYKNGNHYILKDINWQIKKGEKWLLFGLNGCGKTTLLSIIAGLRGGFVGEINVFGEKYNEDNILALRKKIAFVSSSFFDKIFANESIMNIILSGKWGTLGCQDNASAVEINKVQKLLKRFNLQNREAHAYNWLSKGERQNVLLARAMMSEADILILDEPCSGLDIISRANFLNDLAETAGDQAKTIIYVTHYADEILEEFSNIMLLDGGKVFKKGLRGDVLNSQVFSEFLHRDIVLHSENNTMKSDYYR